jgi:hypothetical protein
VGVATGAASAGLGLCWWVAQRRRTGSGLGGARELD